MPSPRPANDLTPVDKKSVADEGSQTLQTNGGFDGSAGDPVAGEDEASRLAGLTENVRDQDDLERDIGRQVSH